MKKKRIAEFIPPYRVLAFPKLDAVQRKELRAARAELLGEKAR